MQVKIRIIVPALLLAIFLLCAGFFSVYYDNGPASIWSGWNSREWNAKERTEVKLTLDYLNHAENRGRTPLFYTTKEESHLKDVRQLFDALRIITIILFLGVVAFLIPLRKEIRKMKQIFIYAGFIALGLVLLLTLLSLNFSWFWSGPFHKVLFPQGNYAFPSSSTLITLFPESFFREFAMQTLLASASYGLIPLIISLTLSCKK